MKITVFSLVTEASDVGVLTSVYGTTKALHEGLEKTILKCIDAPNMEWSPVQERAIERIREHLTAGEVEEAWGIFLDYDDEGTPIHREEDCYWRDEHNLEIPGTPLLE